MTTRLALRIFVGVGLSLLFYIGSSQYYPCIQGDECPDSCYPAEFLGFDYGCGVSGTFPNQRCCLTILAEFACRRNPDCTGERCGTMRRPAFHGRGNGSCIDTLTSISCNGFVYIKGSNRIYVDGRIVIIIYPSPLCPHEQFVAEIMVI